MLLCIDAALLSASVGEFVDANPPNQRLWQIWVNAGCTGHTNESNLAGDCNAHRVGGQITCYCVLDGWG